MSRSSMPWQMRATERAMEIQALGEQAMRIEQAAERLRARAELQVVQAQADLAAAGRLEVLEHQALTKLIREEKILAGLLERAGCDMAAVTVSA